MVLLRLTGGRLVAIEAIDALLGDGGSVRTRERSNTAAGCDTRRILPEARTKSGRLIDFDDAVRAVDEKGADENQPNAMTTARTTGRKRQSRHSNRTGGSTVQRPDENQAVADLELGSRLTLLDRRAVW
jgi:hypothetical protein